MYGAALFMIRTCEIDDIAIIAFSCDIMIREDEFSSPHAIRTIYKGGQAYKTPTFFTLDAPEQWICEGTRLCKIAHTDSSTDCDTCDCALHAAAIIVRVSASMLPAGSAAGDPFWYMYNPKGLSPISTVVFSRSAFRTSARTPMRR